MLLLANETSLLGGFHHLTHDCHCVQPCTENVFETAYSAAAWPAENFNIGSDCAQVLGEENYTLKECSEYYRKSTVIPLIIYIYIYIYYLVLNYRPLLKYTTSSSILNRFVKLLDTRYDFVVPVRVQKRTFRNFGAG